MQKNIYVKIQIIEIYAMYKKCIQKNMLDF